MTLRIYNTLKKKKEPFLPIEKEKASLFFLAEISETPLNALPDACKAIAELCCGLPLMLNIAGSRARIDGSWDFVIKMQRAGKFNDIKVTLADHPANSGDEALSIYQHFASRSNPEATTPSIPEFVPF